MGQTQRKKRKIGKMNRKTERETEEQKDRQTE